MHSNFSQASSIHAKRNHNSPFQLQTVNRTLYHSGRTNSIPLLPLLQKQQTEIKHFPSSKYNIQIRRASQMHSFKGNSEEETNIEENNYGLEKLPPRKLVKNNKLKINTKLLPASKLTTNVTKSEGGRPRVGLKETTSTSTTSFESPNQKKQPPTFLKMKSKTQLRKLRTLPKLSRQGFKIISKLGEGKFGKVFLAEEVETGMLLAIKVVEKKQIIAKGLLDQFIRQLKIQTYLNHPNIIKVYGFFEDGQNFYTLMELGCDGELYKMMLDKKKVTEVSASFIAKNLLQAINYMHQRNILHRDIKPQNIVIIMGNVKICDFGWAANKMTKSELRHTYCGTPLYLSPQIMQGQKYDEKVDLWAIGILTYQLHLGTDPFQIKNADDLYKIMTNEIKFPAHLKVSKEFQQFIKLILSKNPKDRLCSQELLQLKFIKRYEGFETCEELCQ